MPPDEPFQRFSVEFPGGSYEQVVLARRYADEASSKAAWERIEAKSPGSSIGTTRMMLVDPTARTHIWIVAMVGRSKDVRRMAKRVHLGGEPLLLSEDDAKALVNRRMTVILPAAVAGKTFTQVIRRPVSRGEVLRADGTTSPLTRPQG